MMEQAYNPGAARAANAWRDAQDERVRAAKRHDADSAQLGQAIKSPRERTIIEREFGSLHDVLVSLNLTMSEHVGRLSPVLLQPTPVPVAPPENCVEEDLGELGNHLRQARRQIEGVLAQFSDLRFRMTI